jgi:hydroxyacylglutathione hydrolase
MVVEQSILQDKQMAFFVEQIINNPINSNCFIVYTAKNSSCVIIDPGTEDCKEVLNFLKQKKLIPEYIFLTHEHFDHIWGVNKLKEMFSCKLVCSAICAENIINKKKNLSVFYNQIGFETCQADVILKDPLSVIHWNSYVINFYWSPGHSDASICIYINGLLFTGDTIIKNEKTVIKLPSGSKIKLIKTIDDLKNNFFGKKIFIHAGHGSSFWFDEIENLSLV